MRLVIVAFRHEDHAFVTFSAQISTCHDLREIVPMSEHLMNKTAHPHPHRRTELITCTVLSCQSASVLASADVMHGISGLYVTAAR
jgi:hypothetical protein